MTNVLGKLEMLKFTSHFTVSKSVFFEKEGEIEREEMNELDALIQFISIFHQNQN